MENPYQAPSSNLAGRESFGQSGAVTQGVVAQLARTKGWTRLVGVLAIIAAVAIFGFAVTGAKFLGEIVRQIGSLGAFARAAAAVFVVIITVFGGVVLTYGILLVRFSSAVNRLLGSGTEQDLEEALDRQRSFWLFSGIISILGTLLSILSLFGPANTL